jgi:HKD family nuclease
MNKEDIQKSIYTAFINKNQPSGLMNRPRFLSNDYAKGRKVSAAIEEELRTCDSFIFSVAFITSSGFTLLAQVLKELEERNVPGKILTTDYLGLSASLKH